MSPKGIVWEHKGIDKALKMQAIHRLDAMIVNIQFPRSVVCEMPRAKQLRTCKEPKSQALSLAKHFAHAAWTHPWYSVVSKPFVPSDWEASSHADDE